jgi:hypothetical protein
MLRLSPIALLVALAACGGGTKTVTVTQTITRTVTAPHLIAARIYLLRDGKVAPVSRRLASIERSALEQALGSGPTAGERQAGLTTALPGSNPAALAQRVYTLTQFDPSGSVDVGGKTYTRADFEDETPIILVESPLPFAHVSSPLRVTGTANTFEATFDYDLVGADGKVLAHNFVTATSGSGVRGTFAFTARFTVPQEQQGKLVVYEISAKDGSRVHRSEIPLTLEP